MSKKVLVTGANGQLARTLKKLYKVNQDEVDFTFVSKEELDITNPKKIQIFFSTFNFNYCINCAAYTNVEQAEKTPEKAFQVNAEATKYLAQACRGFKIVLFHISTDYVFDGQKELPYKEEDTPNPINEYGKSKLLGEQYIQEALEDYFIIRASWMYSNYGKNFLKTVINNVNEDKDLKIIASQLGAPTSTYSLAKFIYFLIKKKVMDYGVYHFSDKEVVSWYDYAKIIITNYDKSKISLLSPTSKSVSKTKRPKYSALNNSKRTKVYKKEALLNNSIKEIISLL